MIDKDFFEAVMTLPCDNSTMLLRSLSLLKKHTDVELKANENGEVYYIAKVSKLLESNITEETLREIRNASWELKGDFLYKYI